MLRKRFDLSRLIVCFWLAIALLRYLTAPYTSLGGKCLTITVVAAIKAKTKLIKFSPTLVFNVLARYLKTNAEYQLKRLPKFIHKIKNLYI